jgi:type IV secretion system protein VirB10
MTAKPVSTKKAAIVMIVSLFGLVAMLGCQTTQQKTDAMAAKTPVSRPAPISSPGNSFSTVTPRPVWPKMVTIPYGTSMIVALQTRLRTDINMAGESFRANLTEAVCVDQMTVLPAGTEVRGELTLVEEPHRTTGKAQMTLAFQEFIDPAGDLRSMAVSPIVLVAEGDKISDAEKVASGAVIGGVIGALTSDKQRAKGAAIGAAAGAAAGGALALATKGHQLDLPAGQRFEFDLNEPLSLPVSRQTALLQGDDPTPGYAALHPKATASPASYSDSYNQSTNTASYNDQSQYSTVDNRTSDALARRRAIDNQNAEDQARRRAAEALAANPEWPKIVTVPAGVTLVMDLQTHLRTDSNSIGDTFRAHLTEPVRVDQMTVFPVGTEVLGRLTLVEEPHRTSGKAQMTLAFEQIVDPAGFAHTIATTPVVLVGQGDKVSDQAKVGAGAVIGGIIGALSSSKQRVKGAAVGAAVGAAAGGAVALATKGQQLDLPAGQRFAIDLNESMRVSVTELTASR